MVHVGCAILYYCVKCTSLLSAYLVLICVWLFHNSNLCIIKSIRLCSNGECVLIDTEIHV